MARLAPVPYYEPKPSATTVGSVRRRPSCTFSVGARRNFCLTGGRRFCPRRKNSLQFIRDSEKQRGKNRVNLAISGKIKGGEHPLEGTQGVGDPKRRNFTGKFSGERVIRLFNPYFSDRSQWNPSHLPGLLSNQG